MHQMKQSPERDRAGRPSTPPPGAHRQRSQRLNRQDRSARERAHPPDRRDPPFPDIYMPAMPPLKLIAALRRHVLAWRERRWIRQLLRFDDHLLDDLGFSRESLAWALKLPPTMDANEALRNLRFAEQVDRRRASIHDIR